MRNFDFFYKRATKRKGGEAQLNTLLPKVRSKRSVSSQKNDRILSMMSKCIFQAGFVWKVVEKKWPEFETVFKNFNTKVLVYLSPEDIEAIGKDVRIIRNMQKILTVPRNALWVNDIARDHGSFAKFIANWPTDDLIGLFKLLKRQGERLGGMTGQRFLRQAGIDTFILTSDVVAGLRDADVDIKQNPTSQREMKLIQDKFNQWHQETGLPYTHLSKILAFSIGENYDNEFIEKEMKATGSTEELPT